MALHIPDLWPHQSSALDHCRTRKASLLSIFMGGGKTRIVAEFIKEKSFQISLIVCPKSVIDVWPAEFRKYYPECFVLPLTKGTVKQKAVYAAEAIRAWKDLRPVVLVINYESAKMPDFARFCFQNLFDLVVADESQCLKQPGSDTTKFFYKLRMFSKYRIALSGTPMDDKPLDIYGQFKFLDPQVFGTSYAAFRARYAIVDTSHGFPIIKSYINKEDLREKFFSVAFKVDKGTVILPDAIHTFRNCELSEEARKIYKQVESEFYAEVQSGEITIANAMTKGLRLQQITGGNLRLDDGKDQRIDNSKINLLSEVRSEIDPQEPVVVFARFRADIEAIRSLLKNDLCELSGKVNQLAEWQQGKTRVLVAQNKSGSAGIDLTRASYCIYYSLSFSLGEYSQSLARIHRPGQTRPCFYIHLLAKSTIDPRIYKALKNKKDVIESILQREESDEGGIIEGVCRFEEEQGESGRSIAANQGQVSGD